MLPVGPDTMNLLHEAWSQATAAKNALGKRQGFELCPFDNCYDTCVDGQGPCMSETCMDPGFACWLGCCVACGC